MKITPTLALPRKGGGNNGTESLRFPRKGGGNNGAASLRFPHKGGRNNAAPSLVFGGKGERVKGRAFSYKIPRAALLEKRPRIFILLMKRPGCHAGCYHLEMVLSNNRAVQDVPAFAEGYERHTSC